MSWKPEVRTGNDPKFYDNNLAFATKEEAEQSARDLMGRWLLVVEWRVVESEQPVNYRMREDGAIEDVNNAVGEGGPVVGAGGVPS
jgi:hypothetical protein